MQGLHFSVIVHKRVKMRFSCFLIDLHQRCQVSYAVATRIGVDMV